MRQVAAMSRDAPACVTHTIMSLKKHLLTVLTVVTVGCALSALGQNTIIEQAIIGFGSQTNNPDFAYSGFISTVTSDHSTAPGLVQTPTVWSQKSRIASLGTPPAGVGTNVVISPNGGHATISGTTTFAGTSALQVGTTYQVAVSFGNSPTAASTDIVVTNSDTGTAGLDTFAGATSTAFQAGSGYNQWNVIGTITIASANPSIQFAYFSGVNGRWNVDSIQFLPVATPPTAQYWDVGGSLGGSGTWDTTTTNWKPNGDGSGTAQVYVQTDLADFRGTSGTVTITSGGVTTSGGLEFDVNNYVIAGGPLTLDGSAGPGTNITVLSGNTATINSVISGTNGLCNVGAGTVNLGAVNNFTGTVTLTLGKLHLNPGASQSFSSLTGSGALALGANTLTVGGDNTSTTYSGVLSDGGSANPGALIKTGTGTLTLSGANTFYGTTTINQGTLQIGADSGLGTAPPSLVANQLTLNGNGATLLVSSSSVQTINANRGITLVGSNNLATVSALQKEVTLNCPITGSGSLNIPAGWPDFNATNTFTGDLVFALTNNLSARFNTNNSAGQGRIHIMPQTSSSTPCTIRNLAPSGISTTLTNAIVYDESVANALNYNIDTAGSSGIFTLSGNISGPATGGVNINDNSNGQGTVVLSGSNSGFSGGFNLEGGTLSLGSPTALGTGWFVVTSAAGNSSYKLQAATPLTGVNAVTNIVYLNATSGFIIQGAKALELSGPIHLGVSPGVTIEVDNTAATILSGSVGDDGNNRSLTITSVNSGILTLSGSNSFTGGTFIYSGTLDGAASNSIPGDVTVNGGTLQLDVPNAMSTNATLTVNSGTVNLNFTGYQTISSLNGNSGPATYGASANNLGGAITGTGFLNVVPLPPPFSITSEALDSTGTNFVVCWTSVPGQNYDVMTNTSLTGNGAWVSVGNTNATGTTACFTLPGGIVGKPSVFVRIQAP
jgi:autotransporter-associated beta strand protein